MRWNRRSSGIRAEGDNSSALSCTNDEFLHNIPIVMHTKIDIIRKFLCFENSKVIIVNMKDR